jgi:outer membrane protein insertion porin family
MEIEEIRAETVAGIIEGAGWVQSDSREGAIFLSGESLDAATFAGALAPQLGEVSGRIEMSGNVGFSPAGLEFQGEAEGRDLMVDDLPVGTVISPSIEYRSGSGNNLEAILQAPSFGSSGTIRIPSDGSGRGRIDLEFANLDLASLKPILPEEKLAGLKGRASGRLRGSFPAGDGSKPDLVTHIAELELEASDLILTSANPAKLTLRGGRLALGKLRLRGEQMDLTVSGEYDTESGMAGAGSLSGTFDPRMFTLIYPELRTSGVGEVDIRATASEGELTYVGRIRTDGVDLDYPGLPSPVENLRLVAAVDRSGALDIRKLSFAFLGGEVTGTGDGMLQGIHLDQCTISFRGTNMRTEPFSDLDVIFDGQATLAAEGRRAHLTGRMDIVRATFTREFGLSGGAKFGTVRVVPNERIRREGLPISLDVQIAAPADVWIRNRTARMEGSAQLRVTGSFARPELTGRINLFEGGRFRFRDVTYTTEGGGLDFDDPDVIDPLLDLRASTQVNEYAVNLRVLGRYSNPLVELNSEPPLPPREIVSLLVTGGTSEGALGPEASASYLAEENVALYMTAPLSDTLGQTVGRYLGLTSVRIEPQFLNDRANPTARLTLTKQISPEMLFIYSNDLGSNQEQIYQFEYFLSRTWQLVGTRDLDASFSGNLRWRHRGGGSESLSSPSNPFREYEKQGARISEVKITGSPFESTAELRKRMKIREGRKYVRADAVEGRERLRTFLVEHGYPLGEVRLVQEPSVEGPGGEGPASMNLLYQVSAGPTVRLDVEGIDRDKPLKKAVRAAWERDLSAEELGRSGREAILRHLAGKGYSAAEVEPLVDERKHGIAVSYNVNRGPKVSVRSIEFDDGRSVTEKELRRAIATTEDRWNTGGKLRTNLLEEDVEAIRAVYLSHGFLDVNVRPPEVTFSENRRQASIRILIDEGEAWRLGDLVVEGELSFPAETLTEATLLARGEIVRPSKLEEATERLEDLLDANGYSQARIRARVEGIPSEARAVFTVEEGPRQKVRKVIVRGRESTAGRVVRREIEMMPGDPVSRATLLETQRKLYALGIFSIVDVKAEPDPQDPSVADVVVEVVEGDPLLTAVGIGYDTEDQLQGFVQIAHNNIFGSGRGVSLLLGASGTNQRASFNLSDRRLFGVPFEGIATAFYEEEERESFDQRRVGGGVQFRRKLGRTLTTLGRYNIEDVDLLRVDPTNLPENTDLTEKDIRLASVGASIARDTRDDILSPSRGTFSTADLRLYPAFLGSQAQFARLFLSAAWFHTASRRTVFGASARLGLESPFATTQTVPLAERFYAGGDTTLRGFEVDEAGPIVPVSLDPNRTGNPDLTPVGGELSIILNAELRFPIYSALRGVFFYDTGNVFLRTENFRFSGKELIEGDDDFGCAIQDGFRHVLGVGVRIDTPLGPLRLEYGRKLNRRVDEFEFTRGDCNLDTTVFPAGFTVTGERRESPYEVFLGVGQAF